MSIHAQIRPEAQEALQKQRRNSTISSMAVSLLFVVLLALVLGIFLLPSVRTEIPVIVTYSTNTEEEVKDVVNKVKINKPQKPAAASYSMSSVIRSSAISNVAIPVPDTISDVPAVEFGSSDDFGTAWEGSELAAGGASMFGSTTTIAGALKGHLYDLKQDSRGKEISYDNSPKSFANIALDMEKRDFSENAFRDYFRAPNELNLTNLAIPYTPAELGPEHFGAKDSVKPSGWIAAYHGLIAAPDAGRYRFRAASDDFLVVLVDGRRNLVACWPGLHEAVAGDFKLGEQEGSTKSPLGNAQLHAGQWIDLVAGQVIEISLAVGERPGGNVGFVLEVEKEGETYRTDANGRKILPLFTTHPFTQAEQNEIKKRFGDYKFEWEKVPVFGIR